MEIKAEMKRKKRSLTLCEGSCAVVSLFNLRQLDTLKPFVL